MLANLLILASLIVLLSGYASAHCPLCTAGAGAAAAGAAYLGVAKPVLGIFIGALGVSMGWWFAKKIPKQYFPRQKEAVIISSYLLTVIPLLPIIGKKEAFFIGFVGEYGSLLHNTYMYDASLLTSIIGGVIVTLSPRISNKVTELRGEHIDYQGIIVTFLILLLTGVIVQLL